ncbi:MAG: hypothetical protein HY892_17230 [Deltaproteobacteria bacterium]|nr:hypothetical protein [Deltaproteobacteria bacterium]
MDTKITNLLAELPQASKKDVLINLVELLLRDLNDSEKKNLIQQVLLGHQQNQKLAEMVEH